MRRIQTSLSSARVTAVASSSPQRAKKTAYEFSVPQVLTAEKLIQSPQVDAVVIASPGDSHESYLLSCLKQQKPVFCEKPLAHTKESCQRIVEAESSSDRQLIQMGFMRRFDVHHIRMQKLISSQSLGQPLMVHASHRNPAAAAGFDNRMEIMDAAVHEIDVIPWLLGGDPVITCQVFHGKSAVSAAAGLNDPQLVLLETAAGVLIDLEIFTHCNYGFDIGCEIVCEQGTVSLPPSVSNVVKQEHSRRVLEYSFWQERYWMAFDRELQYFIDGARAGRITGPSVWDGYVASAAGEGCLRSQKSGIKEKICYMERPGLYRAAKV